MVLYKLCGKLELVTELVCKGGGSMQVVRSLMTVRVVIVVCKRREELVLGHCSIQAMYGAFDLMVLKACYVG